MEAGRGRPRLQCPLRAEPSRAASQSPEHTAREQGPKGALRAEAPDEHTRGKPGAPRGLRAAGRDAGAWGVASGEGARWGRSPCVGSTVPLPLKCTLNAV